MSAEDTVRAFAEGYRCPDCDAENKLTRDPSGVWLLAVHHDATCPTFQAILRRRTA